MKRKVTSVVSSTEDKESGEYLRLINVGCITVENCIFLSFDLADHIIGQN